MASFLEELKVLGCAVLCCVRASVIRVKLVGSRSYTSNVTLAHIYSSSLLLLVARAHLLQ